MKNSSTFILVLFFIGFTIEAQAQKKSNEQKQQQYVKVTELVEAGAYKFVADKAYTQKGRQVSNLSGPKYLLVNGDSTEAELPYFGVVTGGSAGYGSSGGGISFATTMTDFSIAPNDKKRRVIVKFKARQSTETFNCIITFNSLSSVNLSITGSNRQTIRYTGKIVNE